MIRVGEYAARELGGGLEIEPLEHQKADELRDGHGGVRVVELHRDKLGQAEEIAAVDGAEIAQDVLQRGAGEDVLLLDAQLLAFERGIVRIEHARDVLGLVFGVERLHIVLRVEGVKIELLLGLALPEPKRADGVVLIADDRHVVGHGHNGLIGEFDAHGQLVAAVAPGIAVLGPVVGTLALAVVLNGLLEQAEAVAQAVARERQIAGRRTVEEAGSQSAETAVAERRVLDLLEAGQIDTLFRECLFNIVEDAHIEEIAVYEPADQIFSREVERAASLLLAALGGGPAVVDLHHDREAQAFVQPLRRGLLQRFIMLQFQHGLGFLYDFFRVITHEIHSLIGGDSKKSRTRSTEAGTAFCLSERR